jgi:hypothetical protein
VDGGQQGIQHCFTAQLSVQRTGELGTRICLVQARLVKIVAKKELGVPLEQLQKRLDQILTLLPDLGASPPAPACEA